MSVPYHIEILKTEKISLFANFSNIREDVADENIKLNFYAINRHGTPIFTEELDVNEIRVLYNHLNSISIIKDGSSKSSKFIETTDEITLIIERLKESDIETILLLLQKFQSDEKVRGLLNSLNELEIQNLYGAYHHKRIETEIYNLEQLIELETNSEIVTEIENYENLLKYKAKQPEKIFQNWIEANLWVFGVDYFRKHDERKIALFSEGDLLMETVDGYLDLIELKRPKHELLKFDKSHDCYYPHSDLSIVIGQSLFYLQKLSEYKLNLQEEYKVKVIMPRIKIIVGRNNAFNDAQRNCLRMLNSNLNSIQVITYDDLVTFGKLILTTNESENKVD